MSDTKKVPTVAFMDLYLNGSIGLSRFEDYIALWMEFEYNQKMPKKVRPLREYLGFTSEEYQQWVEDPSNLSRILESRKGKSSDPDPGENPGWLGFSGGGIY